MTALARGCAVFAALARLAAPGANATEVEADAESKLSVSATGFYYAMRDQPDFGVGVASINRGALHLEGRYNYEARDAGSAFVGWKFSGGDAVTFEITPIAGALFGAARGFVPGVEASVAYRSLDAYIEAEYVDDRDHPGNSYYYAWSELGWKPVEWLRLGLVGQRTRVVATGRDLQRGLFAQFIFDKMTLSVYGFNPDSASRYAILSLGVQF
ncbi:MAG TPA: hypothetical protein VMM27_11285 [Casimicrobiaceae bacterium]|nr:hypothetical protein [Casimicrobiaceae bacterium]